MVKEKIELKNWNSHSGAVLDTVNGFDVIECALCSFKHIIPIPTAEELTETYKEDYYASEKPLYLENAVKDKSWWELVNRERFELFESYFDKSRRRLLEIGSGPGYFLLKGKERGWEVTGFEPSTLAAKHAIDMGLDVVNDFFSEESAKGLGPFDVIYMHEVLEHIPNPALILKLAYGLLAPGGSLCVVVPNDYNPIQEVLTFAMGFEPWWVAPPHHINYFNSETLSRLLESRGFEVINSETTFPIDIFLLMGENYIGNDELGRECHARRKNFELNLERAGRSELKRDIYKSFAKNNIGREIVILANKPST